MPLSTPSFASSLISVIFFCNHLHGGQTVTTHSRQSTERSVAGALWNVEPTSSCSGEPSGRVIAAKKEERPESGVLLARALGKRVQPTIERGIYLFGQGDTTAAFMTFDELTLSLNPSDSKLAAPHCLRGVCSLMSNNFEWAGKDFDKSLELMNVSQQLRGGAQSKLPGPIQTAVSGGIVCAMAAGDFNKTLELNRLGLVLGVGDKASLHLDNGRIYFLIGDREKSLNELNEAQDLNSSLKTDCDLVRAWWQRPDQKAARKEALEQFSAQATAKRQKFIATVTSEMKTESDNFFDGEIRHHMRSAQIAAESYAMDHGGKYPMTVGELMPGINNNTNSLTGDTVLVVLGSLNDVGKERGATPGVLAKGTIEYTPLEGGVRYAVRGGDHQGLAMRNGDGTMVLSNQ